MIIKPWNAFVEQEKVTRRHIFSLFVDDLISLLLLNHSVLTPCNRIITVWTYADAVNLWWVKGYARLESGLELKLAIFQPKLVTEAKGLWTETETERLRAEVREEGGGKQQQEFESIEQKGMVINLKDSRSCWIQASNTVWSCHESDSCLEMRRKRAWLTSTH